MTQNRTSQLSSEALSVAKGHDSPGDSDSGPLSIRPPKGGVWQDFLNVLLRNHIENWEPIYNYFISSDLVGTAEFSHGAWICKFGDAPSAFWLICEGQVDISGDSQTRFKGRGAGELIGEQAFLLASQPGQIGVKRSAGMRAHGPVKLAVFPSGLIANMPVELKASWFEFMAHLLNGKLIEASNERAKSMDDRIAKLRLLNRFCDGEALSLVQRAADGEVAQAPVRDTVIWFSDIAGFSSWSRGKSPTDVAAVIRQLLGLQTDLIHQYGGGIDKFMGDAVMGFWFVDGVDKHAVSQGVKCASHVIKSFNESVIGTDRSELSLRIGLHCGKVCFGDFGTQDRIAVTFIGEAVNLAARFEQLRASDKNPNLGPVRVSQDLFERIAAVEPELAQSFRGPRQEQVKKDQFSVYWLEI